MKISPTEASGVFGGQVTMPGQPIVYWCSERSCEQIVVSIFFEKRTNLLPRGVRVEYVDQGQKCMLFCHENARFMISASSVAAFTTESHAENEVARALLSFADLTEQK